MLRPLRNEFCEAPPVVCEERSRRFFESRQVASDGGHKPVCRFLSGAYAVAIATDSAGFVNELPQGDGRATWLHIEPVPMPRQQSHLFGNHAEPRPAGSPGLDWGHAGLWRFSAQVEIDLRTRRIIEDDDLALSFAFKNFHKVSSLAHCYPVNPVESGVSHVANIPG